MSKYMFFDFHCDNCGTTVEGFVKPDTFLTPCTNCKSQARRLISTPRVALPGTDPDFPGAWAKWEKTRKNKRKVEKAHFDRNGTDLTFGGDVKP